jgi:ribosome modulation factor
LALGSRAGAAGRSIDTCVVMLKEQNIDWAAADSAALKLA